MGKSFEENVYESVMADADLSNGTPAKKKLSQTFAEDFRMLIRTYPVTLILTLLSTILAIIYINIVEKIPVDVENPFWLIPYTAFMVTIITAIVGIFFTESSFLTGWKKGLVIFGIVLFSFLSGVYIGLFIYEGAYHLPTSFPLRFLLTEFYAGRIYLPVLLVYSLLFSFLTVRSLIRKNNLAFSEYALGVTVNQIILSVIYGVVTFVVIFIFIMSVVLLQVDDIWIISLVVFLMGTLLLPGTYFSLSRVRPATHSVIKIFSLYILFPILMFGFLVLYIYMGIILFTDQVPSNSLYILCLIFLLVSFTVLLFAENFADTKGKKTWILVGYLLTIPVIALQGYTIGIRIASYGFTEPRIFAVMFCVLELFYLIFSFFAKNKREFILLIATVLIAILLLCPEINAAKISVLSQSERLESFYQNPTSENADSAWSAYLYLQDMPDEITDFPKNISTEKKEKLKEYFKKYSGAFDPLYMD